jgi:drug/metabolite transporter (DMT)-like permease
MMAERPGQTMGRAEWLLLLTLAAIWSGVYVFNQIALDDLPPLTIALGRVGLAAIVLQVALRLSGVRLPRDAQTWGAFLMMGALANVVPFALIIWGQTRIESGLAAILNATTPLFTILAARAMTRTEPLTASTLTGVLAGFGGVVVVLGPEALLDLGGDTGRSAAQIAVLAAACSYALASLYGRRFRGQSPMIPAAGQLTGATVLLLPLSLAVDRPWTMEAPGASSVGAVIGLAVLCSAVAAVLFFRILTRAGATNLGLVTFLIPVGALLLGTTLLHERIDHRQLAGMAVIFSGLVVVDGRLPSSLTHLVGRRLRVGRTHGRSLVSTR